MRPKQSRAFAGILLAALAVGWAAHAGNHIFGARGREAGHPPEAATLASILDEDERHTQRCTVCILMHQCRASLAGALVALMPPDLERHIIGIPSAAVCGGVTEAPSARSPPACA